MGRAHKLKLDHGQYCGSILGLGLSYMQPTMNPCGYLVVKQAEILRDSALCGRGKKYTLAPLYSLIEILIKFEVSPQPFEPVFTFIRESRFNSFCWAVWVVWFISVGSHSSELRINHRLFFLDS